MLEKILLEQCGLDPARPVLAGISGGPDSLCLLDILHAAGFRVIVAHFNHRLRPEADQEAESVSELARRLGSLFVTDSADVRAHAEQRALSLEEAARLMRYQFLFAAAREHAAQAVTVGHTADDQVETVLMHFLRGAGLAGLKGMEYRTFLPVFDRQIPIVRPLLSLWRNDTESYCQTHHLEPHFDASNNDQVYFRNRLRHSLIPELEKYNPRFKESLLRTAQALQGDHADLLGLLEAAWKDTFVEAGPGWVAFESLKLASFSKSLRRSIIRRAAESLGPDNRDFGFEALDRAAAFAGNPAGNQVDFVNGLYLGREKDRLYLASYKAAFQSARWPQVEQTVIICRPKSAGDRQQVELGNGWVLDVEETPLMDETWKQNTDDWSAWLDADRLAQGDLLIRPCRAGDVFSPLGMGGQTSKIRDFYIKVKIPRSARAHWPLVCAGEQIAWVSGQRIAHPFRITEKTRRTLRLEIKRLPKP